MKLPSDVTLLATTIAAALLLLALFAIRSWRDSKGRKKKYPPVAGTVLHQFMNHRKLHHYHTELSGRYKTFRLLAPFRHHVFTVDPANVEYILKTNFKNYGKGDYTHENTEALFGDGIFAVDGEKWRHQRKLASYEFSTKVLRDFSGVTFKENAAKLAEIVSKAATSQQTIDIQDLLMKSTMDSIFKVGFGVELNNLHGSNEGSTFTKEFDNSSVIIMHRYTNAFWKIGRLLNIGYEGQLKKSTKVIDDFVYKLINTRIEIKSRQENESVKKEDILSRFLVEMEKDPKNMTEKYLRDIILNFLIAGKDTTAGTLSWFIYMLCKHPLVQEKLALEVREAIKVDNDVSINDFIKHTNDESIDKMQYLHATLAETLRLYPAVPLDSKVCFSDDVLPDGFNVKKGSIVFYQPYAMGRMKFLWGDDAGTFRPERWINEEGLFRPESPFKFTAFQAGPRICLGKEFAYRQMKIFASVLLHFFKFRLANEMKDIHYKTMITLHIDGGLHIEAVHR